MCGRFHACTVTDTYVLAHAGHSVRVPRRNKRSDLRFEAQTPLAQSSALPKSTKTRTKKVHTCSSRVGLSRWRQPSRDNAFPEGVGGNRDGRILSPARSFRETLHLKGPLAAEREAKCEREGERPSVAGAGVAGTKQHAETWGPRSTKYECRYRLVELIAVHLRPRGGTDAAPHRHSRPAAPPAPLSGQPTPPPGAWQPARRRAAPASARCLPCAASQAFGRAPSGHHPCRRTRVPSAARSWPTPAASSPACPSGVGQQSGGPRPPPRRWPHPVARSGRHGRSTHHQLLRGLSSQCQHET